MIPINADTVRVRYLYSYTHVLYIYSTRLPPYIIYIYIYIVCDIYIYIYMYIYIVCASCIIRIYTYVQYVRQHPAAGNLVRRGFVECSVRAPFMWPRPRRNRRVRYVKYIYTWFAERRRRERRSAGCWLHQRHTYAGQKVGTVM
jgi:hypothetical protein